MPGYINVMHKARSNFSEQLKVLFKFFNKNVPVILQKELADCGLACILMILKYYNISGSIYDLRKRFQPSSKGMSLKRIIDIADTLGLQGTAFKVSNLEDLDKVEFPCIAHWKENHFVVISKTSLKHVLINDPSSGRLKLPIETFNLHFSGIILTLKPKLANKTPTKPTIIENLLGGILEVFRDAEVSGFLKSIFIKMLVLTALLSILSIATPYYTKAIIDSIVNQNNPETFYVLTLGCISFVIYEIAVRYIQQICSLKLVAGIGYVLSFEAFSKLSRLPMDFFQKRTGGEILTRMGSIYNIRESVFNDLVNFLINSFLVFSLSIAMCIVSPILFGVTFFFILIYASIRLLIMRRIQELINIGISYGESLNSFILQTLESISFFKLSNSFEQRLNGFSYRLERTLQNEAQLGKWNVYFSIIQTTIFGLQYVILIITSYYIMRDNQYLSIGELFFILALATRLTLSTDSLFDNFYNIARAGLHIERVSDILSSHEEEYPNPNFLSSKIESMTSIEALEAVEISYFYPGDSAPIFKDISFTIKRAEMVVISGKSGIGKSTLLNCLASLYRPSSGEILINGHSNFYISNYRDSVSVIGQNDNILDGSIIDNITMFSALDNIDKGLLNCCLKIAQMENLILDLPMGLHTLLNSGHTTLSGGQIQRLLIARAIYRKPQLLFMDEATCHLDEETESRIYEMLISHGITLIAVNHRKQIINMADKVISLPGQI